MSIENTKAMVDLAKSVKAGKSRSLVQAADELSDFVIEMFASRVEPESTKEVHCPICDHVIGCRFCAAIGEG